MDRDKQQNIDINPVVKEIFVASKGCSFYVNLAKRILVNDERCSLTALEGAIVYAVDTAFSLERTKHAKIKRIQTSYVTVPKRKNRDDKETDTMIGPYQYSTDNDYQHIATQFDESLHIQQPSDEKMSSYNEANESKHPQPVQQRRARITITMERTDQYSKWLEENTHHVHDESFDEPSS